MFHILYVQLIIKWFYWIIQLWSENLILFMFKESETSLIQASMTYCANIIGVLFYLLEKIFSLITTFFSWHFWYLFFCFFTKFWIFWYLFLHCSLISGFDGTSFFFSSFFIFHSHFSNLRVFTLFICQLHFKYFFRYFSSRYWSYWFAFIMISLFNWMFFLF